jgi:hypothetical protein
MLTSSALLIESAPRRRSSGAFNAIFCFSKTTSVLIRRRFPPRPETESLLMHTLSRDYHCRILYRRRRNLLRRMTSIC